MKKFKITMLVMMLAMLAMLATAPVFANQTIATPDQVIVFKIGDSNYYTQEIGKTAVNTVRMDAAPFIQNGRTFVPVRFLGNALGVADANIVWDDAAKKATLKGKSNLELTINSTTLVKDNQKSEMDVAPLVVNPGRTMLPARYVAEGLGFKVGWDEKNRLVIAYPEDQPEPDVTAIMTKINPPQVQLRNQPAWGKVPTIAPVAGVEIAPPIGKDYMYSVDITDCRVLGQIDNACAILSNILDDPTAGERAKAIITQYKGKDTYSNFGEGFDSGQHHVSVASDGSRFIAITINPVGW